MPVGLGVLPLQLNQGHLLSVVMFLGGGPEYYLETLHQGQPEEKDEEEEEGGPARDGVPEVRLLLDDGVEGDDKGEQEEERTADEPGIVRTLGLSYSNHDCREPE